MKRARAAALAVAGIGVAAPFAPACSLGLNEALIDAGNADAATPLVDTGAPDATPDISSPDAKSPSEDAGSACTKDSDCVPANACRVGTCQAGACSYAVCPTTGACQGSFCELLTGSCTTPAAYGFHAAAVSVSLGPVGCGGDPQACLAAVYPFVFVGTANGVVAYPMNDPGDPAPIAVPLDGVPFLPNQIVASGSRVYFLGSMAGVGPTYKLAVAWLDVPSDPQASPLTATSVFETYPESAPSVALPASAGALYLLNASTFFPGALLTAPLADGASISFYPSPGIPENSFPVVASGSRVVLARWSVDSGVQQTWFSFETGVATSNAQNGGESNVTAAFGPSDGQSMFAEGEDGSVLWSTGVPTTDDAGDALVKAARVAWLVANGTASSFSGATALDVVDYDPPAPSGSIVAGPVAWLDATTALVLAADRTQISQTVAQVATSTPSPALLKSRSYTVAAQVDSVGAAASGGLGFVLAADSTSSCTLHVFAPGCTN